MVIVVVEYGWNFLWCQWLTSRTFLVWSLEFGGMFRGHIICGGIFCRLIIYSLPPGGSFFAAV